jgi:hypothetical protein
MQQLPKSIQELTNEVPANAFVIKPPAQNIPFDDIILLIKKNLPIAQLTNFEIGLAYFNTNTASDKHVIRGVLNIINEALNQAVTKSDIPGDVRDKIAANLKQIISNNSNSFEYLYNLVESLNKDKNLLDVKDIALIILGCAIISLKKIYNS